MNDPHSLDELLRELPWLRRLATALVGGDRAEDVVQDTLVAAIHRRSAGGEFASVRAWLRTVLQNRVRRLARRDAQRREVEGEAARGAAKSADVERDAAELLARADLHRALVEEVTALPRDQRLVVLLRCFEQLEFAAIAARLGIGIEAARSRWRRALSTLRDRLDERTGGRAAWVALLAPRTAPDAPLAQPPVTTVVWAAPALGLAIALGAAVAVVHAASARPLSAERVATAPAEPRQPADTDPVDAPEPERTPASASSRRAPMRTFVAVGASASASANASASTSTSASAFPFDVVPGPTRGPRPDTSGPSGPSAELSVLDAAGLPVSDTSLQAMPATAVSTAAPWPDANGGEGLWSVRTDEDGIARLPWGSAAEAILRVRVHRDGAWIDLGQVATTPGRRATVRIAAVRAATETTR